MEMKTLTVNGQTYTVADPDAAHIDDSSTAPDKTWSAQKLAAAFKELATALENLDPSGVALDTTLTQSGKAADAKAVGDKLGDIETALDSIIEIQNGLIGGGAE